MLRFVIIALATAACTAAAFTPTHLVIVDSTPLYEKGHPFDEAHILTYLGYWTELAATTRNPVVYTSGPSWQGYYVATIKSGAEGLVNAADAWGALVAVTNNAHVYTRARGGDIIGNLDKGEIVAVRNVRSDVFTNRVCIRTKEKFDGYVEREAVEPTCVFPPPPFNKYGEPREGPPQNAGQQK